MSLIPVIRTKYVRHAAFMVENADGPYMDYLGQYPPEIIMGFCNPRELWQVPNNYLKMPYDSVDCKRCISRASKSLGYHVHVCRVSLFCIASDLFEETDTFQIEALTSGNHFRSLVLADWLDEQGDMRGELIRLVCELADRSYQGNPLRRFFLLNRALEIKRDLLGVAGG